MWALVLLSGCGGRAKSHAMPEEAGAAGAPSEPGLGGIDPDAQPSQLGLECDDPLRMLSFQLPCLVGLNLNGDLSAPGRHVVECSLTTTPGQPAAVAFTLPLRDLPEHLNEPLTLPLDGIGAPPPLGVTLGSEVFTGSLGAGVITFSQVDLDKRHFVATLAASVSFKGQAGSSFECNTVDQKIWGDAGSFL